MISDRIVKKKNQINDKLLIRYQLKVMRMVFNRMLGVRKRLDTPTTLWGSLGIG